MLTSIALIAHIALCSWLLNGSLRTLLNHHRKAQAARYLNQFHPTDTTDRATCSAWYASPYAQEQMRRYLA